MEEMQRLVEETIQHFGGLDIIISNAVCPGLVLTARSSCSAIKHNLNMIC